MITKKIILPVVFLCTCAGSVFFISSSFVDTETAPKWYATFYGGVLLLFMYRVLFKGQNTRVDMDKMLLNFCLIIIAVCTAQALYSIVQYFEDIPYRKVSRITGSFDNPAGLATSLCACFPFLFVFIFNKRVWIKYSSIIAGLTIVLAIVLSASRAGIISLLVFSLLFLFYKLKIKTSKKIIIFIASFIILIGGLYFLKKDSANGRLLIWNCTWEMIKDRPMLGHGYGGFKANYMNYQAAFFEEFPNSNYMMLADSVNHPFNEYLLLIANYGIVGFGLFCLVIIFLWKSYNRNQGKSVFARMAAYCLLSIGTFAMFSYPLRYPFTWVMGIMSTVIIIIGAGYKINLPKVLSISLITTFSLLVIACTVLVWINMLAEMKWCKIARKSLLGKTEQMLPVYKTLYPRLNTNELFLYNYAAELNVLEYYDESLQITKECELIWADYDLQMLIGNNYLQKKLYLAAEQYYIKASLMCPNRFMPLYRLVSVYEGSGRKEDALLYIKKIIQKEVKIPSILINDIKNEMLKKIK